MILEAAILRSIANWPFSVGNAPAVQGWGFWLAIIGLWLTLAGFAMTWYQFKKTQTAAAAVKVEIDRIQLSVQSYDAAHHASRASAALDATRRHLRNAAWPDVADSYEDFRRSVLTLQQLDIPEPRRFSLEIEEANKYIGRLCERIESQVARSAINIDPAKTVTMLRRHGELTGAMEIALQKGLVA